ncbi:MAG: response regulator transcription factor [Xanthomonadales bacterium]|nr:response regulator transcription factor [Xanthomonadales bacterium]
MLVAYLEDDRHQGELIKAWLEDSDYEIDLYATARSFISGFLNRSYDLAIIDWELPDIPGLAVLKWIRTSVRSELPVLFLTGRDTSRDVAEALDHGADDYVVKPPDRIVLLARLNALGRRAGSGKKRWSGKVEGYEFDRRTERIRVDGESVDLTRREFLMAVTLLENLDRIVTREKIMSEAWGMNSNVQSRTVDTHASRLRKKLGWVTDNGWELRSVYQQGYRLERLRRSKQGEAE